MTRIKIIALLALGGLVSACGAPNVASRNTPFEPAPLSAQAVPAGYEAEATAAPAAQALDLRVENVSVSVPASLTVSEANTYLPRADIVWRGDPIGNRHAQIGSIFENALTRGTAALKGTRPVTLDIEVKRFHALTEKARYTIGGVHNITFDLTLRDPATGAALLPTREVRADLDAFGGQEAIYADQVGQTQKVRITDHLAEVIRQELTKDGGYDNPRLGFIQMLNQSQQSTIPKT